MGSSRVSLGNQKEAIDSRGPEEEEEEEKEEETKANQDPPAMGCWLSSILRLKHRCFLAEEKQSPVCFLKKGHTGFRRDCREKPDGGFSQ